MDLRDSLYPSNDKNNGNNNNTISTTVKTPMCFSFCHIYSYIQHFFKLFIVWLIFHFQSTLTKHPFFSLVYIFKIFTPKNIKWIQIKIFKQKISTFTKYIDRVKTNMLQKKDKDISIPYSK